MKSKTTNTKIIKDIHIGKQSESLQTSHRQRTIIVAHSVYVDVGGDSAAGDVLGVTGPGKTGDTSSVGRPLVFGRLVSETRPQVKLKDLMI